MRTDPQPLDTANESDRNAKIEQLLLTGLDHYFASEFEQAINVWTRALFLDRNHARARAYIERARSALAERQRESEELLQNGLAAVGRGAGGEARRLLQDALSQGAPRDEALAALDRLNRLESGAAPVRTAGDAHAERLTLLPSADRPRGRGLQIVFAVLLVGLVAAAGMFLSTARPIDWSTLLDFQTPAAQAPVAASTAEPSFAIPLRGERALERARALVAGGHLHDALAALDAVKPTDAQKPEADQLRANIQRQLIGLAAPLVSSTPEKSTSPLP
jgi:hypothetical protein